MSVVTVGAWFTHSAKVVETLGAKAALPIYLADRLWPPADNNTDSFAWPFASTLALPRMVLPSEKVTAPVGFPTMEVTVAVRVIDWPNIPGDGLTDSIVWVPAAAAPLKTTSTILFPTSSVNQRLPL